MTLMEVMNGHRVEELKAVAKRLGLQKTLTRKADIVCAVVRYVEENLEGLLGHLSDHERLLFAEAVELFAKQTSDHLWSLDPQRILDYVESGGAFEDVARFLTQNSGEAIPHTVEVFLNDLAGKLDAVRGTERAILVEMADAEVAARVAHDRRTKSLCRLAAGSYVVVPEKDEQAFRSAMKKLGYVVPR